MESRHFQIRKNHAAKRCEVCHQADRYNHHTAFCTRCGNLSQTIIPHQKPKKRKYAPFVLTVGASLLAITFLFLGVMGVAASFEPEGSIHWAAQNNDVEGIKARIWWGRFTIHDKGYLEQTPLHTATEMNCQDAAIFLVESGTEVNAQDKFGNTALHYAVGRGLRLSQPVENQRAVVSYLSKSQNLEKRPWNHDLRWKAWRA